jgi:glutamyl-tRNA synthetase
LARIGTSLPVEPVTDWEPLAEGFDFSTFGRAPARFDLEELAGLNARVVHQLPFAAAADRLPEGMAEADWAAIRPNLNTVAEAAGWWEILHGHVAATPAPEDADFLREAAAAARAADWSGDPWRAMTSLLKERTGRTGKALFLPLRRALTGRESGPEMAALLPLIGREETIARLGT